MSYTFCSIPQVLSQGEAETNTDDLGSGENPYHQEFCKYMDVWDNSENDFFKCLTRLSKWDEICRNLISAKFFWFRLRTVHF